MLSNFQNKVHHISKNLWEYHHFLIHKMSSIGLCFQINIRILSQFFQWTYVVRICNDFKPHLSTWPAFDFSGMITDIRATCDVIAYYKYINFKIPVILKLDWTNVNELQILKNIVHIKVQIFWESRKTLVLSIFLALSEYRNLTCDKYLQIQTVSWKSTPAAAFSHFRHGIVKWLSLKWAPLFNALCIPSAHNKFQVVMLQKLCV